MPRTASRISPTSSCRATCWSSMQLGSGVPVFRLGALPEERRSCCSFARRECLLLEKMGSVRSRMRPPMDATTGRYCLVPAGSSLWDSSWFPREAVRTAAAYSWKPSWEMDTGEFESHRSSIRSRSSSADTDSSRFPLTFGADSTPKSAIRPYLPTETEKDRQQLRRRACISPRTYSGASRKLGYRGLSSTWRSAPIR